MLGQAKAITLFPHISFYNIYFNTGADPGGGGPGPRAPPLTLGFEAPKLSIFGPYLIFL